jgi:hypothetical protein
VAPNYPDQVPYGAVLSEPASIDLLPWLEANNRLKPDPDDINCVRVGWSEVQSVLFIRWDDCEKRVNRLSRLENGGFTVQEDTPFWFPYADFPPKGVPGMSRRAKKMRVHFSPPADAHTEGITGQVPTGYYTPSGLQSAANLADVLSGTSIGDSLVEDELSSDDMPVGLMLVMSDAKQNCPRVHVLWRQTDGFYLVTCFPFFTPEVEGKSATS